jgi:hypothetical protein
MGLVEERLSSFRIQHSQFVRSGICVHLRNLRPNLRVSGPLWPFPLSSSGES